MLITVRYLHRAGKVSESQNGRDIKDHPVLPPDMVMGHFPLDHVALIPVKPGFGYFQSWNIVSLCCWTWFCVFSFLMCFCWKEVVLSFMDSCALWDALVQTKWQVKSFYQKIFPPRSSHPAGIIGGCCPSQWSGMSSFGSSFCHHLCVVRSAAVCIPWAVVRDLGTQNPHRPSAGIWNGKN